jgi:predicted O-methyltransferase YrrM
MTSSTAPRPKLTDLLPACREKWIEKRPLEFVEYHDNCILPKEFIRLCPWEARYIYTIASTSRKDIVETGRYYGGSTLVLASATRKNIIHSFDIDPMDDDKLSGFIDELQLDNIKLYLHDSTDKSVSNNIDYDVVFIDGDHTYEGVYADLEAWYDNLARGGHVLLHDCYVNYYIQEALMDFTLDKNIQWLVSPFHSVDCWSYDNGTIAHFRKLED